MTSAIQAALVEFVNRSGVLVAAVADARTCEIWSAGDPAAAPTQRIYALGFGSADAVRSTADFLEGKAFLPQVMAQGAAHGALSRTGPWLFGVYYLEDPALRSLDRVSAARQSYARSKALSAELWGALAPALGAAG